MGILRVALNGTTAEQIQFICNEMNITKDVLYAMDEDSLYDVYEAMANIEIDDVCTCSDDEISERGNLAADIVTLWGNVIAEANGFYLVQDLQEMLENVSDISEEDIKGIINRLGTRKTHIKMLMEYLQKNSQANSSDILKKVDDIFNDENSEKEALRCELLESLLAVPDAYSDFVNGICNLLEEDKEQAEKMIQYIKDNPDAQTDDCIEFLDEYIENMEYEDEEE